VGFAGGDIRSAQGGFCVSSPVAPAGLQAHIQMRLTTVVILDPETPNNQWKTLKTPVGTRGILEKGYLCVMALLGWRGMQ